MPEFSIPASVIADSVASSTAGVGAMDLGAGAMSGGSLGSLFSSPMLGGLLSGGMNLAGTAMQNSANMGLNQATMNWETEMSNTAVQRRAADMSKAGINPILAAGNPASQPSFQPLGAQSAGGAGTAALQGAASAAQVANIQADTAVKNAQASQITASTYGPGQFGRSTEADIGYKTSGAKVADAQVGQIQQQVLNLQQDLTNAKVKQGQYEIDSETAALMQEGLLKAQALDNKLKAMGLQIKGPEANVATTLNDALNYVHDKPAQFGSWLGGKAADVKDAISDWIDRLKHAGRP